MRSPPSNSRQPPQTSTRSALFTATISRNQEKFPVRAAFGSVVFADQFIRRGEWLMVMVVYPRALVAMILTVAECLRRRAAASEQQTPSAVGSRAAVISEERSGQSSPRREPSGKEGQDPGHLRRLDTLIHHPAPGHSLDARLGRRDAAQLRDGRGGIAIVQIRPIVHRRECRPPDGG
jgi:hypothetical protein